MNFGEMIDFCKILKKSISLSYRPRPHPSFVSIFCSFFCLLFIGLWVKTRYQNEKPSYSKSNPLQSSRSKLTSCPRTGFLIRFQVKSQDTSDGSVVKLGIKLWYELESQSQPKFAAECLQRKHNDRKTYKDLHWLGKHGLGKLLLSIEDFFSNLPHKIIIHCVTEQPLTTGSQRPVLNYKLLLLTFLRLRPYCTSIYSIKQKLGEVFSVSCRTSIFDLSNPKKSSTWKIDSSLLVWEFIFLNITHQYKSVSLYSSPIQIRWSVPLYSSLVKVSLQGQCWHPFKSSWVPKLTAATLLFHAVLQWACWWTYTCSFTLLCSIYFSVWKPASVSGDLALSAALTKFWILIWTSYPLCSGAP